MPEGNAVDPWHEEILQFLLNRGKSKMVIHEGVYLGKKRSYFRGKRATAVLLDEPFRHEFPDQPLIKSAVDAKRFMQTLIDRGYLQPAEKLKQKVLQSTGSKDYNEERYYAVLYDDPAAHRRAILKGFIIVLIVLALITFPYWPEVLRIGAWYLAVVGMVLMGVLIAILVIRVPLFYLTRVVVAPGVWIFPNLNEDGPIMASFKPVWDFDQPEKNARRTSRWRRRAIRDDHGSGSENRSGSQREDGEEEDADDGNSPDSATTSTQDRASNGAGKVKTLVQRLRDGAIDLRVDSENDGDNEGAEAEGETDPQKILQSIRLRKRMKE